MPVCLSEEKEVTQKDIFKAYDIIKDARMQNMALLGTVGEKQTHSGVSSDHFRHVLEDLLQGDLLTKNVDIFEKYAG
jgi:hypothetical protein